MSNNLKAFLLSVGRSPRSRGFRAVGLVGRADMAGLNVPPVTTGQPPRCALVRRPAMDSTCHAAARLNSPHRQGEAPGKPWGSLCAVEHASGALWSSFPVT